MKLPDIERLEQQFEQEVLDVSIRNMKRATVTIGPDHLVAFSQFLYRELHFRFIIASAMETSRGIEILYHFSRDPAGLILNLLVILDKEKPEIESLTGLFEAANWIEREMHEIIGIHFKNHPNLEKLISEGNWAEGVYPYRKSEKGTGEK
ncbi:MAG: NADH-quinone oxidoreductase subunit C [Bacteroidales bacterium]|nr:NADH-quinone oxidoreductase subunit C [Bacteroidales bacterium]